METKFILWFEEIGSKDVGIVGGKNASLGEMYRNLTNKGIRVPNGFAITAHAYRYFIESTNIGDKIKQALTGLDKNNSRDLETRGQKVRDTIMNAEFPKDLIEAISKAYEKLQQAYYENIDVAVRSSATAEDLPDASFAGQQETYLNIKGTGNLLYSCKRCFASLFTNRAISYREDKHFDHFAVALSIGVQKMVRSDKATSGVMFTIDTESGFTDIVLVTASWGLGENVVQGHVNPDEYLVFKPTLKEGKSPIISKSLGSKELKMVYDSTGTVPTKNTHTPIADRNRFCCSDEEVLTLAKWACLIEDHYTQLNHGKFTPMDVEWAKDGNTNELYVVQARPETVHSQEDRNLIKMYHLKGTGKVIATGGSIGTAIGTGKAHVIKDVHGIHELNQGEVLITSMTDPDWEPVLKKAAAIVTDRGGRTCHAAIISRELGIPCIVGCGNATEVIKTGRPITIDCSQGEKGHVIEGLIEFEVEEKNLQDIPKLQTKIMMNVANPESAFDTCKIPNSGVGLARMEFIISNHIKAHPLALLHMDDMSENQMHEIRKLTRGYDNGKDFFVSKLSQGIGTIAAAFYPKPVILRFSDFKTDEYANLLGGKKYEPEEANPMLGWRGASRYYDPKYREGFALECEAVHVVREIFGLTNLQVMIPFCRTVDEAKKCISELAKNKLVQHQNGLKIIGMCEIPSNVILADEFLDILDGFSIGSNDLTQLVLGVDRNSECVSDLFDERNEAVKKMISQVIKVAVRKKKYIGICGQAPSDFPEFAEFVVREGIESISLNPDSVLKTIVKLAEMNKPHQTP